MWLANLRNLVLSECHWEIRTNFRRSFFFLTFFERGVALGIMAIFRNCHPNVPNFCWIIFIFWYLLKCVQARDYDVMTLLKVVFVPCNPDVGNPPHVAQLPTVENVNGWPDTPFTRVCIDHDLKSFWSRWLTNEIMIWCYASCGSLVNRFHHDGLMHYGIGIGRDYEKTGILNLVVRIKQPLIVVNCVWF